jgi:hypothetical protein
MKGLAAQRVQIIGAGPRNFGSAASTVGNRCLKSIINGIKAEFRL